MRSFFYFKDAAWDGFLRFVIPAGGRNLLSDGASDAYVDAKSRFLATLGMTNSKKEMIQESRLELKAKS
jgi:hypothetical protein